MREIESSEYSTPFLLPVDLDQAPGYSDVIDQPMDLKTIKKKNKSGAYENDVKSFIADMKLIQSNCITYNDPESDIAKWADNLLNIFDTLLNNKYRALIDGTPVVTGTVSGSRKKQQQQQHTEPTSDYEPVPTKEVIPSLKKEKHSSSQEKLKDATIVNDQPIPFVRDVRFMQPISIHNQQSNKKHDIIIRKATDVDNVDTSNQLFKKYPLSQEVKYMKSIWKAIHNHSRSGPFHVTYSGIDQQDYKDLARKPMDLYSVKNNLYMYEEDPVKFLQDMRLVFDNCILNHLETSPLHKDAGDDKISKYLYKPI